MNSGSATLRVCNTCGHAKPVGAFASANIATGRLQSNCRRCHAAYRRMHYLLNRDDYIRRAALQTAKKRIDNRQRLRRFLLLHPCVDCGETDPIVLDLDHRDPTLKIQAVTWLAARKRWPVVAAEIDKCDVRCANCHRLRTARQFGWSKLRRAP